MKVKELIKNLENSNLDHKAMAEIGDILLEWIANHPEEQKQV